MTAPTLLVLAAGTGSRYGGLKLNEPVGPNGEIIMDYSIHDALRAGFGKVVFVLHRGIELAFKEMVSRRYGKHLQAEYVFQDLARIPPGFHVPLGRTAPWGTTHAILMAAEVIHTPFAVINVYDFYGAQSYHALAQHLMAESADYAVMGFVLRNTLPDFGPVARAICQVDDHGYLENVVELKNVERMGGHAFNIDAVGRETRLTGDEVVSMNMWGFTPHIFPLLHQRFERFLEVYGRDGKAECYIPNTVNELLAIGQARVKVLRSGEDCFGLTYREDHPRAVECVRRLVEDGHYPRKLW